MRNYNVWFALHCDCKKLYLIRTLYCDTQIQISFELYVGILKYKYNQNFVLGYSNTDIIRTLYWDTQILSEIYVGILKYRHMMSWQFKSNENKDDLKNKTNPKLMMPLKMKMTPKSTLTWSTNLPIMNILLKLELRNSCPSIVLVLT